MLAMVRGIGPKDEIEAMMAAQMAAVYMTTTERRVSLPAKAMLPLCRAGECPVP
jgi:hypothetical protein